MTIIGLSRKNKSNVNKMRVRVSYSYYCSKPKYFSFTHF